MKVSVRVSDLDEGLNRARRALSERAPSMAYSGILLETAGDQLQVLGSDGENSTLSYVAGTIEEPGSALVPAKPLAEWLRTLSKTATVVLEVGESGDLVAGIKGEAPYHFKTLSIDYKKPPIVGGTGTPVDLSKLGVGLGTVRASVDTSGSVQVVSSADDLHLNTTDTYRLSQAVVPNAGWGDFSGRISLAGLSEVAGEQINAVAVDQKGRLLEFIGPKARFTLGLSSAPFPYVEGALSASPAHEVSVSLEGLKIALTRLNALSESSVVTCTLERSELSLSVISALGEGTEVLSVEGEGEIVFAVSLEYFRAALAGREGSTIGLGWTDPIAPLYLVSTEPLKVTTLVMPVRVQ